MKIIVGLGNPGKKYELTRHNVGFMAIDRFAEEQNINFQDKHKALIGTIHIEGQKVLLVKPQTYMNLSGESLSEIVNYYKIDLEDILVVYDDIDIPLGKIRIRKKGSAGTHNGMRSIVSCLSSTEFPRMRLGIGKGDIPLIDYVLQRFSDEELNVVNNMIEIASKAIKSYILDGIDLCMNKYNR